MKSEDLSGNSGFGVQLRGRRLAAQQISSADLPNSDFVG
jgi:hypothetical protein